MVETVRAEDDWDHHDHDDEVHPEVPPGEPINVQFLVAWGRPAPHPVYVPWDGAPRPQAVEVQAVDQLDSSLDVNRADDTGKSVTQRLRRARGWYR